METLIPFFDDEFVIVLTARRKASLRTLARLSRNHLQRVNLGAQNGVRHE
jgi:hypothetical protein